MASPPSPAVDYYAILGLQRHASDDAIKRGYKREALKWHPDKHHGRNAAAAEDRFRQIAEAYRILSDPQQRVWYDRCNSISEGAMVPYPGGTHVVITKKYGWSKFNIGFGYMAGPGEAYPPAEEACGEAEASETEPHDPFDVFRGVFGARYLGLSSFFSRSSGSGDGCSRSFNSCVGSVLERSCEKQTEFSWDQYQRDTVGPA
mmetsp:Transcript_105932/g.297866  ORF Transcript_105932/g.297866 Transcript_105932/m.297866 type:complete len:203 (-) Transcript_105932:186-794(-)